MFTTLHQSAVHTRLRTIKPRRAVVDYTYMVVVQWIRNGHLRDIVNPRLAAGGLRTRAHQEQAVPTTDLKNTNPGLQNVELSALQD